MNQATKANVFFCPKCDSPSITCSSAVLNGPASCDGCGWTGLQSELTHTVVQHELGSDEKVLEAFAVELRNVFAKHAATPLAFLLKRWGFIPSGAADVQAKTLTRYIAALAKAMAVAVIEERRKIEKESTNVPS